MTFLQIEKCLHLVFHCLLASEYACMETQTWYGQPVAKLYPSLLVFG